MRRPVLYLAGLLLATGASLALAGPASAAVSDSKCDKGHHHHHHGDDWDGHGSLHWSSIDDSFNTYNGLNILTGGLF